MPEKLIRIKTESGEKEIIAVIIGRFGVHYSAGMDDNGKLIFNPEWYSVTHIATGLSVMRMIETRDAAIDFASRVNRELTEAVIERTLAGDKAYVDDFVRIIKAWANYHEVIYSY